MHSSALIVTVLIVGWEPNNMTWCAGALSNLSTWLLTSFLPIWNLATFLIKGHRRHWYTDKLYIEQGKVITPDKPRSSLTFQNFSEERSWIWGNPHFFSQANSSYMHSYSYIFSICIFTYTVHICINLYICFYTHHIYTYAYFNSVGSRKTTVTPQLIFSCNSKKSWTVK